MTKYEERILYPNAVKILEALGYKVDSEVDVHTQFMLRYQHKIEGGIKRKRGRPFKSKKNNPNKFD